MKSKKIFSKKIKKILEKFQNRKSKSIDPKNFRPGKFQVNNFFYTTDKKLSGVPPIVQRVNALLAFTLKKLSRVRSVPHPSKRFLKERNFINLIQTSQNFLTNKTVRDGVPTLAEDPVAYSIVVVEHFRGVLWD